MASKIGDEHGAAKKANNIPIKNGYQKRLVEFDCGICFTIVGSCRSIIPASCKPKTIKTEPKIIIKIGISNPPKTFPADAHKMPITLKMPDKPSENANNFKAISERELFFVPQTYAKINGKRAIEQGDTDEIIPPKNEPIM